MSSDTACKSGFLWDGRPSGTTTSIASLDTYLARSNSQSTSNAILIIHDIFGWTLPNARLLADCYAQGTGADVYLPDFFGGQVLDPDTMSNPEKREKFDMDAFRAKNGKEQRWPEIQAVVKALRETGYRKIGAIGFCWAGVIAPENDQQFTPELKKLTQETLLKNKVEHEYIDFPGLNHGFAVRGDKSDAKQREGLEKAMQDFINWSNRHFK